MNPLLMPVVAVQGMRVRQATVRLAPAGGPTEGSVTGAANGPEGDPLRVGVLGESTAAGCGVDTHDDGFAGGLARELAARTGRPVRWQVVGQHGATARRIRHRLLPRLEGEMDVAVLLAGVNDVLTRRPPEQWGEDVGAVVDGLAARAGQVAVTGIPPFDAFPSLPSTLARYLAERAAALDAVSRRVCAGRPRVTWVGSAGIAPVDPGFFARDRFHPSGAGYRRWAGIVADHLTR